jgi:predicted RNase H-like HicB family nuclease
MQTTTFTALIEKEGDGYVALCQEFDVASQGDTVEEAKANLREAVELFLECAAPDEIARRHHPEFSISRLEAAHGLAAGFRLGPPGRSHRRVGAMFGITRIEQALLHQRDRWFRLMSGS